MEPYASSSYQTVTGQQSPATNGAPGRDTATDSTMAHATTGRVAARGRPGCLRRCRVPTGSAILPRHWPKPWRKAAIARVSPPTLPGFRRIFSRRRTTASSYLGSPPST